MSIQTHDNDGHSQNDHPHVGHSQYGHSHLGAHETLSRIKLVFFLNFGFVVIEFVGGFLTNSMAILSDATHDLGDCLAILIAYTLEKKSLKKSDLSYSYGYRRLSLLSAVISGAILITGSLLIISQSIPRLLNPQTPELNGMLGLAILGVIVNSLAAFKASKGHSLNEKMIMWHMLEDVFGWMIVLIGSIVMRFIDFPQLDSIMAIALSLWVLYNVFRNIKSSIQIFLMSVPNGLPIDQIESKIKSHSQIHEIHHTHYWSLDGQNHILTTHVVVSPDLSAEHIEEVKKFIKQTALEYNVIESTIEVEFLGTKCADPTHNS